MLVKLYHSRPLLPWQRNLENLKTKVGYNSACIRDIANVLASNRVFLSETMNRVRQLLSDDTEVFILLVHYYHTVNFKNHVIRAN